MASESTADRALTVNELTGLELVEVQKKTGQSLSEHAADGVMFAYVMEWLRQRRIDGSTTWGSVLQMTVSEVMALVADDDDDPT